MRYMLVTYINKRHIFLFPNKSRYGDSVTYKVRGKYQAGTITRKQVLPKFDGIDTFSYLLALERRLITYHHPNIEVEILPRGIDKLPPKVNKTKIDFILNRAKET